MSHKREDMKDSSLGTKFNIFSRHIFPYFETVPIDQITADDIANWQMAIKDILKPNGKALSDSYLRTIQSQFNSVINYAHSKGYLKSNPLADIKNMGIKDKRVVFWSPEEYERFAYHAMNYPEYYYAYEILYWCGLRQGEMFALQVRGESMINAGILDGDVVLVRRQNTAISGQIIVALIGEEATVKRLALRADGVWLMPENPAFEPIDGRECAILGLVVSLYRPQV